MIQKKNELHKRNPSSLTTSRLNQQSSVEFGEKICKLKAEDNYERSLVKAPETQKIMLVMDSGSSMHNAEQRELSSDRTDALTRSKTP